MGPSKASRTTGTGMVELVLRTRLQICARLVYPFVLDDEPASLIPSPNDWDPLMISGTVADDKYAKRF